MQPLRSFLFAPGNHARRVEKALSLDADAVILDLEDAVATAEKKATRATIAAVLDRPRTGLLYVRVNAVDTEFCYGDLVRVVRRGLDGLILPSKFYGVAAAGRAILVVGSPDGELAGLVAKHHCGYCIAPGQSAELARIIAALCQDLSCCRQLGANARRMLEESLTKARSLERWRMILRAAAGVASPVKAHRE